MIQLIDILRILSDGAFHSGEDIARALSVSRTAIWKHLQRLDEIGLRVESVKGAGYRLSRGIDLIDADSLTQWMSRTHPNVRFEYFLETDSTSDRAMASRERLARGEVYLAVAERQLKGRGRRGRQWESPFASNLYLSLGFWWPHPVSRLQGLSLAMGVCVVEALDALGAEAIQLKWPNDIVHATGKLGGILIEIQGEMDRDAFVVVGLGVNGSMTEEQGAAIGQPWTTLASLMGRGAPCRTDVLRQLTDRVIAGMTLFEAEGFGPFFSPWTARDAMLGRRVHMVGTGVSGIAKGIASTGEYLIDSGEGVIPVGAGEVSLREDHS